MAGVVREFCGSFKAEDHFWKRRETFRAERARRVMRRVRVRGGGRFSRGGILLLLFEVVVLSLDHDGCVVPFRLCNLSTCLPACAVLDARWEQGVGWPVASAAGAGDRCVEKAFACAVP